MKLSDAEALARKLMDQYDLIDQGWVFRFDRATRRFGVCRFRSDGPNEISLSRHLVALNDPTAVEDTIRHEIAHALAGKNQGHGARWREACALTGARPERCYDDIRVASPEPRYAFVCPRCHLAFPRHRRGNLRATYLCGACRQPLEWTLNPRSAS